MPSRKPPIFVPSTSPCSFDRRQPTSPNASTPAHPRYHQRRPRCRFGSADPTKMHDALRNLIEDAVIFSSEGGNVELAAKVDGDRILLTVSDEGPGVPEAIWDVCSNVSIASTSHARAIQAHGPRPVDRAPPGGTTRRPRARRNRPRCWTMFTISLAPQTDSIDLPICPSTHPSICTRVRSAYSVADQFHPRRRK